MKTRSSHSYHQKAEVRMGGRLPVLVFHVRAVIRGRVMQQQLYDDGDDV